MKNDEHGPRLQVSQWPALTDVEKWEERIRINARRVRAGWGEHLAVFPWERFVTLTCDPKRAPNMSERSLSREVFRLCGDIARWSRRPVAWAYMVEGGGGGHLHAHVLLIGARDDALRAAQAAWEARNGTITTRAVDDIGWAARYLCKAIGPNGEVVISDTLRRNHRAGRSKPETARTTAPD